MSARIAFTLDHLERLSNEHGLFEHAKGIHRRVEHGLCTDDNARMLVVVSRESDTGTARRLGRLALGFVLAAQDTDGRTRNRMDARGLWTDEAGVEDCWGRGLWALGTVAARHADPAVRRSAQIGFDRGAGQRSPWTRAMAFAALGAAAVLRSDPQHIAARSLLNDTLVLVGPPLSDAWPWPEARLTYANAALAESVIACGVALDRPRETARGLAMLAWLLEIETRDGHLSVVGVGGRGPGTDGPQFDQQPIEVAAMADACTRACEVTGHGLWLRGVALAADWFAGNNDTGLPMYDDISGGGFDGLHEERVNLNQGAESTLAFISTMQRARALAPA